MIGESTKKYGASKYLTWALRYGLPSIIFAYIFLLLLVPLADPDLFWHLKSGQWTIQSGEIPGREDPFAFTTPTPLTESQIEGLRSQWLGQVVLYIVYAIGGYPGLVVFRSLLILVPFMIVYSMALKKGLSPLWALSLVSLPALLMALSLYYTFERPQGFTVVLSFALVPILERLTRPGGRGPWVALLGVLMALWSNLHGGFIFGVVMIVAFASGMVIEAAVRRDKAGLFILLPATIGIGSSMLNPNTYSLLYKFIRGHLGRFLGGAPSAESMQGKLDAISQVMEYKPLWFFYKELQLVWPLFIIAFIALVIFIMAAGYISSRRVRIPHALLAAMVIVFSLYYSRGVMLALVVLPLFAVSAAKSFGKLWRFSSAVVGFLLCASLVSYTVQRSPWQLHPEVPPHYWVDATYPEDAVRFIKEAKLEGPMFNEYTWGGYLMWELHPEYKVFIDGRIMSAEVLEASANMMNALPGTMRQLDAFGVNFIIVQPVSRLNGVIAPILLKFLEDEPEGWRLVYMGESSAVLARKTPRTMEAIGRYGMPYKALYGPIYAEAEAVLAVRPGFPNAMISMAIALSGLERYSDAEAILRALPPSPIRDEYLRRAEQGKKAKAESR